MGLRGRCEGAEVVNVSVNFAANLRAYVPTDPRIKVFATRGHRLRHRRHTGIAGWSVVRTGRTFSLGFGRPARSFQPLSEVEEVPDRHFQDVGHLFQLFE